MPILLPKDVSKLERTINAKREPVVGEYLIPIPYILCVVELPPSFRQSTKLTLAYAALAKLT